MNKNFRYDYYLKDITAHEIFNVAPFAAFRLFSLSLAFFLYFQLNGRGKRDLISHEKEKRG